MKTMETVEIPEIKETENATLAEDITEYRFLVGLLEPENKPKFGWASWLGVKMDNRTTYIARAIANRICADTDADTENENQGAQDG